VEKAAILCVDDTPAVLRTTELILQTANYAVSTAATADDARWLLKSRHFDLILLDCVPEHERVVQEARRGNPHVRIAIITGNPALRDVPFVDVVLHKPILPPLLLTKIAELLSNPTAASKAA